MKTILSSVVLLWSAMTLAQVGYARQAQPANLFVEGYANQLSYAPNEELQLHLSSGSRQADLIIERVGAQRKLVHEAKAIAVSESPVPVRSSSHGCDWPVAFRLPIPQSWESGYYEVTFTVRDSGGEFTHRGPRTASSKCFFIIRSAQPGTTSRILLQLSTNTYNAYTNWGGHSLYAYHDRDALQGHRVSFHRPLTSQYGIWELPFVAWCEQNGFALDYAVNNDLEFRPELLKNYRLVLSVGHDEYWSAPMRDNLEAYIKGGGNVAFLSGNTCCWQVRSEENGRDLICYKQWYNIDPLFSNGQHKLLSTLWSHHLVARPENQLTGVGFLWGGYHRSHGQFMDGPASYEIHRPEHWLFAKTGLKQGDRFGGEETIVGYECDGCEIQWRDGLPFPTGNDGTPKHFSILATCPAKWAPDDSLWYDRFPADRVGNAVLGIYTDGGTVLTTGSTDWSHGLRGKTPLVEQMTRNILTQLSQDGLASKTE